MQFFFLQLGQKSAVFSQSKRHSEWNRWLQGIVVISIEAKQTAQIPSTLSKFLGRVWITFSGAGRVRFASKIIGATRSSSESRERRCLCIKNVPIALNIWSTCYCASVLDLNHISSRHQTQEQPMCYSSWKSRRLYDNILANTLLIVGSLSSQQLGFTA